MNNPEKKVYQYELNEAYEGEPFDMIYVNYTNFTTFSVAMFFCPILPIGLLLGVIEVGLNYIAWKW